MNVKRCSWCERLTTDAALIRITDAGTAGCGSMYACQRCRTTRGLMPLDKRQERAS